MVLAHSLLQPNADGSVYCLRLRVKDGKVTGRDGVKWSHDDFVKKISRLTELDVIFVEAGKDLGRAEVNALPWPNTADHLRDRPICRRR